MPGAGGHGDGRVALAQGRDARPGLDQIVDRGSREPTSGLGDRLIEHVVDGAQRGVAGDAERAFVDAIDHGVGGAEDVEDRDRGGHLGQGEAAAGPPLRHEDAVLREHAKDLVEVPHGDARGVGDVLGDGGTAADLGQVHDGSEGVLGGLRDHGAIVASGVQSGHQDPFIHREAEAVNDGAVEVGIRRSRAGESSGVNPRRKQGDGREAATWARWWLVAAGLYNLVWGTAVVAAPGFAFDVLGIEPPRYPSIWQCVGMIVGVYGVGYLIASSDPARHWSIVLVGLLGKILGPIGFVWAAARGELPWTLGWTIVTNDLLWWVPFAAILWHAMSESQRQLLPEEGEILDAESAMRAVRVDGGHGAGSTLAELSGEQTLLVVFLRHSGCTFCREALSDLRKRRATIEESGGRIVLVHLGDEPSARSFFDRYELGDVSRISDPGRVLYRAFRLARGTFLELLGPRVVVRGIAATLAGHGAGPSGGDGFQMPGAFVVRDGRVIAGRPHRDAADRPDYVGLACGVS